MAAQVLSGSGNVTYTNSTGQNVRIVINYLKNDTATGTMTFQGVTVELQANQVYGKTLAFQDEFAGGGREDLEEFVRHRDDGGYIGGDPPGRDRGRRRPVY